MILDDKIILALPKGRILDDVIPLVERTGLSIEDGFFDDNCRQLAFSTNLEHLAVICVRSFDMATFVSYGAAQIGIAGSDVIGEFSYPNLYSPVDLEVGKCRLSLASPMEFADNQDMWNASHVRVATKYVNLTKQFFAKRGIQAECIKLNGSIELAPKLGLCRRIVDLVSTGETLRANGLVEVEKIMDISSKLIINRSAFKTNASEIDDLIKRFADAVG